MRAMYFGLWCSLTPALTTNDLKDGLLKFTPNFLIRSSNFLRINSLFNSILMRDFESIQSIYTWVTKVMERCSPVLKFWKSF